MRASLIKARQFNFGMLLLKGINQEKFRINAAYLNVYCMQTRCSLRLSINLMMY